jgi:hypothetical protein
MSATLTGKCHLCTQERKVTFCQRCGHWFCQDCEISSLKKFGARALSAIKELVGAGYPGCCGPLTESE